MEGIKKTLVNSNGHISVEKAFRTDVEKRVYKINNAIEMERLDKIAADIKDTIGGDIIFNIISSQHDGILGFTDLIATALPCVKYTNAFIESKCKDENAYHRKFPWVCPYNQKYIDYYNAINDYLLNMSKKSTDTIYGIGELKQTTKQSIALSL